MIKEEKKSLEVIEIELKRANLIDITERTIRNYIYDGNVFNLNEEEMIYNKNQRKKTEYVVKASILWKEGMEKSCIRKKNRTQIYYANRRLVKQLSKSYI